jgi:signal transduction histidine kinase
LALTGLAGLTPVNVTMGRLAAVVRGTVTAVAVVVAVIGTVPPLSWAWVLPALVVLVAWTCVYVAIAWSAGVRAWLAAVDLLLAAGLALAIGQLVPAAAQRGTSWVAVVISMMIICAQLTRPSVFFVAGGIAVAACYVLGAELGGIGEAALEHSVTLATQAVAAAVVMRIATRAGRDAADTFEALQEAESAAEIDDARRADALADLRLLHNGPLTTLTMAIHAEAERRPSILLRRRAAENLRALSHADESAIPDGEALVRLDERLAQVVVWYDGELQITTRMPPCVVPVAAADAFADATSESLENVVRHAAATRVLVEVEDQNDVVRVRVADRGRGFDPATIPRQRFGYREAIVGRMTAAGGSATVGTAAGQGTTVSLEWPRG